MSALEECEANSPSNFSMSATPNLKRMAGRSTRALRQGKIGAGHAGAISAAEHAAGAVKTGAGHAGANHACAEHAVAIIAAAEHVGSFSFGVFGFSSAGIGVGGRTDRFIGVHGVCVNNAHGNVKQLTHLPGLVGYCDKQTGNGQSCSLMHTNSLLLKTCK